MVPQNAARENMSGDGVEDNSNVELLVLSVHHDFFSIVRIDQLKIPGTGMNHELSVRDDGTASAIRESMAKFHELNYKPMLVLRLLC